MQAKNKRDEITQWSKQVPANTKNRYSIIAQDLPLSCPMPQMELWNSHPRVFLAIEETGQAKCPYCGAEYILIEDGYAR